MSAHHRNGPSCELCEIKKGELHPTLAFWVDRLRLAYPDLHLAWGYRDEAAQNQFFAEGKTRCKYPNSAHNKTLNGKPCSEAFDCFRLRPDGVAEFRTPWYSQVFSWLQDEKAPIDWAGHWTHFEEFDHYQISKSCPR